MSHKEDIGVRIEGHVLIRSWSDRIGGSDAEEHLNKRNAIHKENMAIAVARALAPVGAASIAVAGHTDAIGTDTYNQALSEKRARTVADALRTRGVKGTLSAKGFGESRPVAPNELNGRDNPAGRQLNRRVEIFVKA